MTISAANPRATFIITGATTPLNFNYPWEFDDEIKIYADGELLDLGTHYSLVGAGQPSGGRIMPVAALVGSRWDVIRMTRISQVSVPSDPVVGFGLDRATRVDQDARRDINRAIKYPIDFTGDSELPRPEANKFLAWNAAGTKLVNKALVNLSGFVAGAAGLAVLAKDTLGELRDYIGVTGILSNLGVLNFSTGMLLNSTQVDHPLYVIATGQSNMLGHSVDGGDRSTKNNSVYVFEAIPSEPGQTVGWKRAGPGSPDWPLLPTGNSLAYQFADQLQRETGKTVCLLIVAAGGQPIAEWLPGGGGATGATGSMWGALAAAHTMALDTPVPGRPDNLTLRQMGRLRADYFLWHQGEADADYRPSGAAGPGAGPGAGNDATYKARFRSFINAGTDPASVGSSAEPFIWADQTPILIGDLFWGGTSGGNSTDDRNVAIAELDRENAYFIRVSARNLGSLDGLHFTGSALCTFGNRYFARKGLAPKVLPRRVAGSTTIIDLGGGIVLQWGTVTVNTGGSTVVTLPVNMADANYVPTLTLVTSGTSTPNSLRCHTFAQPQFQIENNTGSNQTVRWQVIGLRST